MNTIKEPLERIRVKLNSSSSPLTPCKNVKDITTTTPMSGPVSLPFPADTQIPGGDAKSSPTNTTDVPQLPLVASLGSVVTILRVLRHQ